MGNQGKTPKQTEDSTKLAFYALLGMILLGILTLFV